MHTSRFKIKWRAYVSRVHHRHLHNIITSSEKPCCVSFCIFQERHNAFHNRCLFLIASSMSASSGFSFGGNFLTSEQKAALEKTAAAVATPGKGITACDEGPGTIGGRFEAVGIESTEENRRKYRQMLFEAPGCENYLSAAILDPETLYQKSDSSGKLFPELLTDKGIVPGVKPHLKVSACSSLALQKGRRRDFSPL